MLANPAHLLDLKNAKAQHPWASLAQTKIEFSPTDCARVEEVVSSEDEDWEEKSSKSSSTMSQSACDESIPGMPPVPTISCKDLTSGNCTNLGASSALNLESNYHNLNN